MRNVNLIAFTSFSFIIVCILILGCHKPDECRCLKSNGKQIDVHRNLGLFNKIVLEDNINLTLSQDTVNELVLNVPENLANFVVTDVKDNVLYIHNDNKCNWLRSFKIKINVFIKTRDLQNIDCNGSGYVKSEGFIEKDYFEIDVNDASSVIDMMLKTKSFKIKLNNGPSDIHINGYTEYSSVYDAGSGNIFMQNFDTKITDIRSIGTGKCYVKASDYLSATLEYAGDINYYGDPAHVYLIDNGEGEIIKH